MEILSMSMMIREGGRPNRHAGATGPGIALVTESFGYRPT
jgi:hypothetical protein